MNIKNIITLIALACFVASPVYAKKDKDKQLPPGLQKKAAKGKSLPPGWQKKLAKGEIMDKSVYRQSRIVVPVDSRGLITVSIEGKLVRLYKVSREIVEIIK